MAKLRQDNGEEVNITKSIGVSNNKIVVDGKELKPEIGKLLHSSYKTPDGTVLISEHRHDYVTHKDANGKVYMLDGGTDYIKTSGYSDVVWLCVYSSDSIEKIRGVIGRSGYGKDGTGPFISSLLKDMSDEWVKNSIIFTDQEHLKDIYNRELRYRKENNIIILD